LFFILNIWTNYPCLLSRSSLKQSMHNPPMISRSSGDLPEALAVLRESIGVVMGLDDQREYESYLGEL
jgi:hypothetical protein